MEERRKMGLMLADLLGTESVPARAWEVKPVGKGGFARRQLDLAAFRGRQCKEWENNISDTRSKLRLSQSKFATLLGISIKTLHNWEQGRRKPTGAARVLLRVAARHPEVVLEEVAA